MKEDFQEVGQQLARIGILRICKDFYMEPQKQGSNFFVRSPRTKDRTPSLALYPQSGRFCDFSNGNKSGDCCGLVAYTRNISQWQALQELKSYYCLSGHDEKKREETRRRIETQKAREHEKARRRQAFRASLMAEIDVLKRWEHIYSLAIEKAVFEPFSELWVYCQNELQRVQYKLDVLTAADCNEYRRMKMNCKLPSDRPEWLLDVLAILAESDSFHATGQETEQIKKQRDNELSKIPIPT